MLLAATPTDAFGTPSSASIFGVMDTTPVYPARATTSTPNPIYALETTTERYNLLHEPDIATIPDTISSTQDMSNMIYFYCFILKSTPFYKPFNLATDCIDVVQLFDDKVFFYLIYKSSIFTNTLSGSLDTRSSSLTCDVVD